MPYSPGRFLVMYLFCFGGWAHAAHAPKQHLSPYQQQIQQNIKELARKECCLDAGVITCQCLAVVPLSYAVQHTLRHEPFDKSISPIDTAVRNGVMCAGFFCQGVSVLFGKWSAYYRYKREALEQQLPQEKKEQ